MPPALVPRTAGAPAYRAPYLVAAVALGREQLAASWEVDEDPIAAAREWERAAGLWASMGEAERAAWCRAQALPQVEVRTRAAAAG